MYIRYNNASEENYRSIIKVLRMYLKKQQSKNKNFNFKI